jgi:hypothetical protein
MLARLWRGPVVVVAAAVFAADRRVRASPPAPLAPLLTHLQVKDREHVVGKHAQYYAVGGPAASSCQHQGDYDGDDQASFRAAVAEACKTLRSDGQPAVAVQEILDVLGTPGMHRGCDVHRVDAVIVAVGPLPVVRLNRVGGQPKSGYTLVVDMGAIRRHVRGTWEA